MATTPGGRGFTYDARVLERLLTGSAMARELGRRAELGTQEAKRLCPTSPAGHEDPESPDAWLPPGHLRSSIRWELGRDAQGLYVDIGTDAAEAPYVEFGTAPHVIESHGDYPLRDRKGNVFGQVVNHPGTDAQPFLRPGLERALRG